MQSLRVRSPEPIEFVGIGGPLMEEDEGFNSLLPLDDLNIVGIWEVLWQLPRLLKIINGVVEEIERAKPDVVITIDFPDFNFFVADRLKKRGKVKPKMVHYAAPTVWAWRPARAEHMAKVYDHVLCLYPFEPKFFTKYKLDAQFVGHPLAERHADGDRAGFREDYKIADDDLVVAVLPGSRELELKTLIPIFKDTLFFIKEQFPNAHIVVPTLPNMEFNVVSQMSDWPSPLYIIPDRARKWDAFAASDVAIAASGTVGLELAYAKVPHIVAYKIHPLTALVIRMLVKVKFVHLMNIIANERVVPELLQNKCNPFDLGKALYALIKDKDQQREQIEKFAQLPEKLGVEQKRLPSEKAADSVLEIIGVKVSG